MISRPTVVAMLGAFVLVSGCGGASGAPDPWAGCSGSVTGRAAGGFVCRAAANYYYMGGALVGGRTNSVITIRADRDGSGSVQAPGVDKLGANVEVPGEPAVGTFVLDPSLTGTGGFVTYQDGVLFATDRSLTLTLTEVTFRNDYQGPPGEPSRQYVVSGTLDFTVAETATSTDVAEVSATF